MQVRYPPDNGFFVTTSAEEVIVQEVYAIQDGIREQIMRIMMDTQDIQIRQALIKLGWTPPAR